MTKRFKTIKSNNKLAIILIVLVSYFILNICLKYISNLKLYKSSKDMIEYLISDNNNIVLNNKKDYLSDIIYFTSKLNMKEPISMVKETINLNNYYLDEIDSFLINPKDNKNPIIYLYSSDFSKELINKNNYNINSTMLIIYILKGILDKNNISTNALNIDLTNTLELNNKDSYEISRLYLKEAFDKYRLKLAIDIQIGDSDSIVVDNKKCAKINFIINQNYKDNVLLANKLINNIKNYNSRIIDDVIETSDEINEDINNVLVIKIGSTNSSLEEIYNTLNVLGDSIKKLVGEING